TLANTPRVSAQQSPSAVRAPLAAARMQSGSKAQKVLRPDKCPRTRSRLPPGEFCRLTRSSSSHRRRTARARKPRPAREVQERFSSDRNFDQQHVRSLVTVTLRRVSVAATRNRENGKR